MMHDFLIESHYSLTWLIYNFKIYNFIPNFPLHYAKLSNFEAYRSKHSSCLHLVMRIGMQYMLRLQMGINADL